MGTVWGWGTAVRLALQLQARARWWSSERGLSALKGARRAPGRDGNEPPGVRTAQRRPLGWAETFPAPRHNVCKYQRPLMAGPPAGRARGAPSIPLWLGAPRAPQCPMDTPWHPRWWGEVRRGCPLPLSVSRCWSQGSRECRGGMSPLNAHHAGADSPEIGLSHPVWAALHLHSWGLVRLPPHSANTNST